MKKNMFRSRDTGTQGKGLSPLRLITISDQEFHNLSTLIYERLGIHITDQKRPLIVSRLQTLLHTHGHSSFAQYYNYIVSDKSESGLIELANRITTNHTYFNRENTHFEFLTKIVFPGLLSHLEKTGNSDVRIWCAGCSTGEEAYMLTMLLLDFFEDKLLLSSPSILATDISQRALTIAKAGIYSLEKISSLPPMLKQKYFTSIGKDEWAINTRVKNQVLFRSFNLMNTQLLFQQSFFTIFCRNVMIYFDQVTIKKLVNRFYTVTDKGGYLFIGHSESLGREDCPYQYIKPAVYEKV